MTTVGQADRSDGCVIGFGPLATVREVLAGALQATETPAIRRSLVAMARYIGEFLTAPHPQLGRAGAVCPYAGRAVEEDCIHLTACRVSGHGPDDEARIREGMLRLMTLLSDLEQADRAPTYRAVVAVFPGLSGSDGARMIERVQRDLKLSFIKRRLMIGQFFPGCGEPGLRNPDFRPLQAPVVSLAVRNIAISDAPFMLDQREYVDAYLRIFDKAGAERVARARLERDRARRSGQGKTS